MEFGLFMMPLHPPHRTFADSYERDIAQIVLADQLGFREAWVGEHLTERWENAPAGETVWTTTSEADDPAAPHFGEAAARVYNVIDTRQSYLQDVVAQGLRGLGHAKEAANSIHFSYEIVALTPRCAAELGYELNPEDAKKPYVEVSGRKGLGVKADDLITKLQQATQREVSTRHAEMSGTEQKTTAHAIAVGALRFFLLKFTRNTIIAFDFEDALSFEGETGPYVQYAIVRVSSIFRKAGTSAEESLQRFNPAWGAMLEAEDDIWELWLTAGKFSLMVDQCISTTEPAYLAKYAFQLGQLFNNFYHRHHILTEEDVARKSLLLATAAVVRRELVRTLSILGIEAPDVM